MIKQVCLFSLRIYSSVFGFFLFLLVKQKMIGSNESSTEGPIPTSYLSFLAYLLGEWTGVEHTEDYLSYGAYLSWVLFPLAIVFILPVAIFFFCFNTSLLLLHIYKRRKNGFNEGHSGDVWYGAKEMLANLWDGHGRVWHGKQKSDSSLKSANVQFLALPVRIISLHLIAIAVY